MRFKGTGALLAFALAGCVSAVAPSEPIVASRVNAETPAKPNTWPSAASPSAISDAKTENEIRKVPRCRRQNADCVSRVCYSNSVKASMRRLFDQRSETRTDARTSWNYRPCHRGQSRRRQGCGAGAWRSGRECVPYRAHRAARCGHGSAAGYNSAASENTCGNSNT